nr:MAG TPA: hypothetical protein [Caudoviricetes sp.]DAH34407.1 MAG TPA: hypothetical protein [Bacteriophage sp.]
MRRFCRSGLLVPSQFPFRFGVLLHWRVGTCAIIQIRPARKLCLADADDLP